MWQKILLICVYGEPDNISHQIMSMYQSQVIPFHSIIWATYPDQGSQQSRGERQRNTFQRSQCLMQTFWTNTLLLIFNQQNRAYNKIWFAKTLKMRIIIIKTKKQDYGLCFQSAVKRIPTDSKVGLHCPLSLHCGPPQPTSELIHLPNIPAAGHHHALSSSHSTHKPVCVCVSQKLTRTGLSESDAHNPKGLPALQTISTANFTLPHIAADRRSQS